jgi:hypothetical protein
VWQQLGEAGVHERGESVVACRSGYSDLLQYQSLRQHSKILFFALKGNPDIYLSIPDRANQTHDTQPAAAVSSALL